jgi:hypothetical protein
VSSKLGIQYPGALYHVMSPERGRISTHFIEVAALDAPMELLLKNIRHPESLPHPLVSALHSC